MDTDPYASDVCSWWHSSQPTLELVQAVRDGWLGPPGQVLDLGCGLATELTYLAECGFSGVDIDLSTVALQRAHAQHPALAFVCADVLHIPLASASCDVVIDRGCFHYLTAPSARAGYAAEAFRVLRPGGRLLLRACLYSAGVRNDLNEHCVLQTFAEWRRLVLTEASILSDTRTMPALISLFERPG